MPLGCQVQSDIAVEVGEIGGDLKNGGGVRPKGGEERWRGGVIEGEAGSSL